MGFRLSSIAWRVSNIHSKLIVRRNNCNFAENTSKLVDSYGRKHRYLRISLSEKCNLRCKYCMPECGVKLTNNEKLLTSDEIYRIAKICVTLGGVDKIRLTGGEPTIRSDILDIVDRISSIENLNTLGMTTNGIITSRIAKDLKSAGLNIVNISLDTLDATKYKHLTRRNGLHRVMKSIESCLEAGFDIVKINCVLMNGFNDNEIIDFINLTKYKELDIRFIEYMPFDGNTWKGTKIIPYKEIVTLLKETFNSDLIKLNDPLNHTAKAWKINNYKGRIGFITSMTENFCSGCDRIRITADGHLKVCLFGNEEICLRDHLRNGATDAEIIEIINKSLKKKEWKHAGMENLAKNKNRPMILIDDLRFLTPKNTPLYSHIRHYSNYYDDYANIFNNYKKSLPTKDNINTNSDNSDVSTEISEATIKVPETPNKSNHDQEIVNSKRDDAVELTHWTSDGARMVNVGDKRPTVRSAKAEGHVLICSAVRELLAKGCGKGDVLTVAQIAGIQAAKRTSSLIPLCHQLPLSSCDVTLTILSDRIYIHSEVTTTDQRTGVEMEALVAVSIASLTVYDMLKSASKSMTIGGIQLLSKTGGKSDYRTDY